MKSIFHVLKNPLFVMGAFIILFAGISIFNYTHAQKGSETPTPDLTTLEDVLGDGADYRGLFDDLSAPQNYLKNGNFYSNDKPRILGIDTSYIDKVDTAIWWYDKVLEEYPGTEEAREALRAKIRTLIGWEKGYGKDKKSYGLHHHGKNKKYFPLIETTFLELEMGYPDDEYLEAFAYQIAQRYLFNILVYGRTQYEDNCKRWLEKTIMLSKGRDTFYSHLSRLRLRLFEDN